MAARMRRLPRACPLPWSAISIQSRNLPGAAAATRVHEISEQDSTDFDKALRHLDVPLVLAVGFTGARLDHELAVFHTLVARPGHRCIVIGERDIVFHAPPRLRMDLAAGTRVSLFPMTAVRGRSSGAALAHRRARFHPAHRIGTSNAATGGMVEIETDAPGLWSSCRADELDAAVAALSAVCGKPVDCLALALPVRLG
jgi:thiamine pyrophosphokinase